MLIILLFSSFRVPRRYRVVRVAHATAYVHEVAATAVVKRASATGMIRESRARGNKATHDHVFLQTPEVVLQTPNRRLGEDTGSFLERRRGNERFGGQRRLGDAQQHGFPRRLVLALGFLLGDDVEQAAAIHLFAAQQCRIAGVQHLDFT